MPQQAAYHSRKSPSVRKSNDSDFSKLTESPLPRETGTARPIKVIPASTPKKEPQPAAGKADNKAKKGATKAEKQAKNFQKKRPSRDSRKDEPIIPVKDVDDIDQFAGDDSQKSVPGSRDVTQDRGRSGSREVSQERGRSRGQQEPTMDTSTEKERLLKLMSEMKQQMVIGGETHAVKDAEQLKRKREDQLRQV